MIVTGHCGGGHVEALRASVEAFDSAETAVLLLPSFEPTQDTYPSNHAAWGETAYQLLFEADTVDLGLVPPAPTLDDDGIWGDDPRTATVADGAAILALFLDRTVPRIENCGKGQPVQTMHTGHHAAPARFKDVRVGVKG